MGNLQDLAFDFASTTKNLKAAIKEIENAQYYDCLFTFNGLSSTIIFNFVFTDENFYGFEKYLFSLPTIGSTGKCLSEDFIRSCKNQGTFNKIYKESKNSEFFKILTKYLLYKRLNDKFEFEVEKDSESEKDFAEKMIVNQKRDNACIMFRGQQNYAWELAPSLIRNLTVPKGKGLFLDAKSLHYLFNEGGASNSLLEKYEKCFDDGPYVPYFTVNYRFLAWMQHAVSYSPLLDFTSSYPVALSFAIKENNPSNFLYDDSAVYILKLSNTDEIKREQEVDDILNKMHIVVLKGKIKPGSTPTVYDCFNKKHLLDFTTFDKILLQLMPKYAFIDIPTNDRMLRQKGKFLLFYDYVSVNGRMFPVMIRGINGMVYVYKHRIKAKDKPGLVNYMRDQWPDIKNSYLMDPYSIFND